MNAKKKEKRLADMQLLVTQHRCTVKSVKAFIIPLTGYLYRLPTRVVLCRPQLLFQT